MPRVARHLLSIALILVAGCRAGGAPGVSAISFEDAARLRARATMRVEAAYYYKPRPSEAETPEGAFAPLIVEQLPAGAGEGVAPSLRFGLVLADRAPRGGGVDSEVPTVYTARNRIRVAGGDCEQFTYVWWYPRAAGSPRGNTGAPRRLGEAQRAYRGVRITIGRDGFPMVWEIASSDDSRRLLFVSSSLERSARLAHGVPLPGRQFAIERGVGETPDTVVVGVLEDGPVPMGPYVYLDAPARSVLTVLCRCSPSQVDRFDGEFTYDLVPLEFLDAPLRQQLVPPADLAALLRWPPQ